MYANKYMRVFYWKSLIHTLTYVYTFEYVCRKYKIIIPFLNLSYDFRVFCPILKGKLDRFIKVLQGEYIYFNWMLL